VGHALVLNATYEPLCVVSQRRALVLVLTYKAIAVEDTGVLLHSAMCVVPAPAVVRLNRYVRVPYRAGIPLTRRAIFARDGGRCVYCGGPANSVDHVVPRSRGGRHVWENVVAACRRCNSRKENHQPHEAGLSLLRQPFIPKDGLRLSLGRLEPEWEAYL
jgi:5-methylcytosine-specific restriction endonuclease McrA